MNDTVRFFYNISFVKFIVLGWIILILHWITFGSIILLFDINAYSITDANERIGVIDYFFTIVCTPIFETLIFQKLPYWGLSKLKFFKNNIIFICLISSIIFGALHYYSITYMLFALIIGMVFMFGYICRQGKASYWTIVLLHSLYNLTLVSISLVEI